MNEDRGAIMQRQLPRRTLAKSAAWSVPVVVAAGVTPAFAASQCVMTSGQMELGYASGQGTVGRVTMKATSRPVGVSVDSRWNLQVDDTSGPLRGPALGWMEITQWPVKNAAANAPTYYQDVTFTFNQPVQDLSFVIADLDKIYDWNPDGYDDRVAITQVNGQAPTSGQVSGSRGSLVAGTGTLTDPWRNTMYRTSESGLPSTDTRAYVTVTVRGETTSFTLRYWSTAASSYNTQAIWVGIMTYSVCL